MGVIWQERKKNAIGLPWTFTVYSLDEERFNVTTGLLSKTYDEIKLYRITDFTVRQSFLQRIFGLGTIHICSSDSTSPEFDIVNIKKCREVKDLISKQVDIARERAGVKQSEFVGNRPHI